MDSKQNSNDNVIPMGKAIAIIVSIIALIVVLIFAGIILFLSMDNSNTPVVNNSESNVADISADNNTISQIPAVDYEQNNDTEIQTSEVDYEQNNDIIEESAPAHYYFALLDMKVDKSEFAYVFHNNADRKIATVMVKGKWLDKDGIILSEYIYIGDELLENDKIKSVRRIPEGASSIRLESMTIGVDYVEHQIGRVEYSGLEYDLISMIPTLSIQDLESQNFKYYFADENVKEADSTTELLEEELPLETVANENVTIFEIDNFNIQMEIPSDFTMYSNNVVDDEFVTISSYNFKNHDEIHFFAIFMVDTGTRNGDLASAIETSRTGTEYLGGKETVIYSNEDNNGFILKTLAEYESESRIANTIRQYNFHDGDKQFSVYMGVNYSSEFDSIYGDWLFEVYGSISPKIS